MCACPEGLRLANNGLNCECIHAMKNKVLCQLYASKSQSLCLQHNMLNQDTNTLAYSTTFTLNQNPNHLPTAQHTHMLLFAYSTTHTHTHTMTQRHETQAYNYY